MFVFKAMCPKGRKAKSMKGRPDHAEPGNKQEQNHVEVGQTPRESVPTTWPVFSPLLLVIASFMPRGRSQLIWFVRSSELQGFLGGSLSSQTDAFAFTGLVCTLEEELDQFLKRK